MSLSKENFKMSNSSTSGSECGDVVEAGTAPTPAKSTTKTPIKTGSCGKRPRSSMESFAQMTCPTCQEYFTPPIVQCYRGHSVCLSCVQLTLQLTRSEKCPLCRANMRTTCRNYALEAQMEHITIGCRWGSLGCMQRVPLTNRAHHEAHCVHRPDTLQCYYTPQCLWQKNPLLLSKHLKHDHHIETAKMTDYATDFVWKLPEKDTPFLHLCILKVPISQYGKTHSKLLLEFRYHSEDKIAVFTVRSLEKDFKPKCKLQVCDRENQYNGPCNTFLVSCVPPGPQDCVSTLSLKDCLSLPYVTMRSYSYSDDDSQLSFSMRVEFPLDSSPLT